MFGSTLARDVTICFVHFRTTELIHLDAAWYSLSKQDFTNVNCVVFLDNNTLHDHESIQEVLYRYPLPVPLILCFAKHGDLTKTHSWSVNTVCNLAPGPYILFLRTDYILAFDALEKLYKEAQKLHARGKRPFVTSHCFQMGYDANLSNTDDVVDIEKYGWREKGMSALLCHPWYVPFTNTDKDAGVWFTSFILLSDAGWMNEKLVSWGYQQSVFQRKLKSAGGYIVSLAEYLFAHQHHYAPRDFKQAEAEYNAYGNRF